MFWREYRWEACMRLPNGYDHLMQMRLSEEFWLRTITSIFCLFRMHFALKCRYWKRGVILKITLFRPCSFSELLMWLVSCCYHTSSEDLKTAHQTTCHHSMARLSPEAGETSKIQRYRNTVKLFWGNVVHKQLLDFILPHRIALARLEPHRYSEPQSSTTGYGCNTTSHHDSNA